VDKISSMRVFAKVVELGSFSGAANDLQLSAAAVTRHVADLEKHLGTRLLYRSTRSLSLTERGELYLDRSLRILADIDETEALVAASDKTVAGILKLSVVANFGLHVLPELLARFSTKYPDIRADVILSDGPIDLIARGRDLAVTFAGNFGEDMVARALMPTKMILCAAPEYLAQYPTLASPADLASHQSIVVTGSQQTSYHWELADPAGERQRVNLKPAIFCNTAVFAHQCVLAGLGISMFSSYIARHDLDSGRLVRVLPDFELPDRELFIAYPNRRFLAFKVRAFIEFLAEEMQVLERERPARTKRR
jgi:DNA-binding transcriptional LysR family regulator